MIAFRLPKKNLFAATAAVACIMTVFPLAVIAGASPQALQADGRRPLRDVAGFYGFPHVNVAADQFVCSSAYSSLGFEANSRRLTYNGTLVYLNGPVGGPRDRWRIDAADVDTTIDALLRPSRVLPDRPTRVIVIDPGHGGADLGAVGARNVEEKRVVLDIARRVRTKLQSQPFTVHLTREDDYYLGLEERVERANALGADLFVSIHINSVQNTMVSGVETFVLPASGYPPTSRNDMNGVAGATVSGNSFDAANTLLGYLLQKELLAVAGTPDRGLKRARFAVLKGIRSPAALVECGFVSNPHEEERFLQAQYRDQLAEAIARAIRSFAGRIQ